MFERNLINWFQFNLVRFKTLEVSQNRTRPDPKTNQASNSFAMMPALDGWQHASTPIRLKTLRNSTDDENQTKHCKEIGYKEASRQAICPRPNSHMWIQMFLETKWSRLICGLHLFTDNKAKMVIRFDTAVSSTSEINIYTSTDAMHCLR